MATFDDNIWYRIKSPSPNATAFSFDNDNNGQPNGYVTLSMQPTGDWSGQIWQITTTDKGYYQFCAMWWGPDWRMGYWKTNDSQPTYYPGLFGGQPRHAPSQQWEITQINGADGAEQYSIVNHETKLYMDLGANRGDAGYEVYLGGQEASEVWTWEITVVEQINNASYSAVPSTSSASAKSSHRHTSSILPGSTASASASAEVSPQHSSHLGLYVGVPIAVVLVIALALATWCVFRRRKRRARQSPDMAERDHDQERLHASSTPFSSDNAASTISPLTPRNTHTNDLKSPAITEYFSPDSPAFGRKGSQEVAGTPVAEMESRGPEQKATERVRSPLAEPRLGGIRGVAELE